MSKYSKKLSFRRTISLLLFQQNAKENKNTKRTKSPSRGEFSTKGQARVRTRSVKVQKAQLSFIFIWLAADLSILFSSLKIAPKITRQKLMSDNPTSSEEKKLCKSLFSKYLVGRLLTFPHFSQLTLSYQSQEKTISKATFPEDFTWYRSVSKRK